MALLLSPFLRLFLRSYFVPSGRCHLSVMFKWIAFLCFMLVWFSNEFDLLRLNFTRSKQLLRSSKKMRLVFCGNLEFDARQSDVERLSEDMGGSKGKIPLCFFNWCS